MPRLIKWILLSQAFLSFAFGYELVIIQGLSTEKQTFITRGGKDQGVFQGENRTFTSDNVSVIAKAITVSREFTQWEIKNDFTEVPFRRGDRVVMYDAKEYLWALSPAEVQRKLIKTNIFRVKRSMEAGFAFSRGISETTSEAIPQNLDRGGYQFDGLYRKELSFNYAYAFGVRYVREVINAPAASFVNQRFLGILEGRYYFDPLVDFYNSRVGLSFGVGFGQSRTETAGLATFGTSVLLPSFKASLSLPINDSYEVDFLAAFESL